MSIGDQRGYGSDLYPSMPATDLASPSQLSPNSPGRLNATVEEWRAKCDNYVPHIESITPTNTSPTSPVVSEDFESVSVGMPVTEAEFLAPFLPEDELTDFEM